MERDGDSVGFFLVAGRVLRIFRSGVAMIDVGGSILVVSVQVGTPTLRCPRRPERKT